MDLSWNGIKSAASDAAESVQEAASSAAESVESAAGGAADAVSDAARGAYDAVKETASGAAEVVEQKVENAAEWTRHQADQGARWIEAQVRGKDAASADNVEGGVNQARKNSGNPDEVVDLSSNDKVHEFLKTYGQKDQVGDTDSDMSRCQSNVIVAGLLMKGGQKELQSGLEKARADAQSQLKGATGGKKAGLEKAIKDYDAAIDACKSGNVTRGHMDRAANALFHTMTTSSDYTAKGELNTEGIGGNAVNQMERKLGLSTMDPKEVKEKSGLNPANWFKGDDLEAAENLWDEIPSGRSAHVGGNLYGEHKAQGAGPNGETIEKDRNGNLYYQPSDGSKRVYVEKDVNHAMLFGKTPGGQRYIYNPLGDPPYMVERPGDKASSKAIDDMSRALMAKQNGDYRAKVTTF